METAGAKRSMFDGRWQLVRAEMEGEVAPELLTMKTELELTLGAYRVRFDGEVTDSGTFEVGNSTGSKTLIFRGAEGPNAGRMIPSLVQHVGERLRICYGLDGTLPADFKTAKGKPTYSAVYRPTKFN